MPGPNLLIGNGQVLAGAIPREPGGGHAILCNGVNVKSGLYRLHNSWGESWGVNGEAFISRADMATLLKRQGEACIPVKRLK